MGCLLRCLAAMFTIIALVLLVAMSLVLFAPLLLFFLAIKLLFGGLL